MLLHTYSYVQVLFSSVTVLVVVGVQEASGHEDGLSEQDSRSDGEALWKSPGFGPGKTLWQKGTGGQEAALRRHLSWPTPWF